MKRDPENGMLVGKDGCHYETEWEARYIGTLGMCGCGSPEESYGLLRQILIVCDRRNQWINNARGVIAKLVTENPELTAEVLMHFLTDKDVLEHGTGVGGSWLTEEGMEIVDGGPAVQCEEE